VKITSSNTNVIAVFAFVVAFAMSIVLLYTPHPQHPTGDVVVVKGVVDYNVPMQSKTTLSLEQLLKQAAVNAGLSGNELAAFMAQCAHETMNFFSLVETGTPAYFNRYDPLHAPSRAARLGNTRAGDGERYRGRGYIQLTGRYNYRIAGDALSLPLEDHPELAAVPHIAASIAIWYWDSRVRPRVDNFADVRAVTRPINPGLAGLAERRTKFKSYQVALL
jgi:predicted chitinase